jgi:hypothetical protein
MSKLRPGDREPVTLFEIAQRHQPDQAAFSTEIPKLPPGSPWSSDPVPIEPATGVDGEAVPDLTKVKRGER